MKKLETLYLIDAIAVICIVYHHAQFNNLFRIVGLTLFSLSAGYKFGWNHSHQSHNKEFLKRYAISRISRLGRPYVGYTLMVIPAYIIIIYICARLNIYYDGLNILNDSISNIVYKYLLGNNIFAYHMWYLYTLLVITLISLVLLYIDKRAIYLLIPISLTLPLPGLYAHNWATIFVVGYILARFKLPDVPKMPILSDIGRHSFHIYLLHWPFILTILLRGGEIFKLPDSPIALTAATIILSIIIYKVLVFCRLNRLIEPYKV